jgi:hypothetical protein
LAEARTRPVEESSQCHGSALLRQGCPMRRFPGGDEGTEESGYDARQVTVMATQGQLSKVCH